jgi:hypothetical protein
LVDEPRSIFLYAGRHNAPAISAAPKAGMHVSKDAAKQTGFSRFECSNALTRPIFGKSKARAFPEKLGHNDFSK